MTDPNTAQATALIAALQDQLGEMVPKLVRAEQEATVGRPSGRKRFASMPGQLRRDVDHARFLIAHLQRRFPEAEITGPAGVSDPTLVEVPTLNGDGGDYRQSLRPATPEVY